MFKLNSFSVTDFISDVGKGIDCLSPSHTHGPLVTTGINKGKVRSRNKDGRWRAKRSDVGQKRK